MCFNVKIILMEMLEMTIKAHHCFRIIIRRLGPGLAQLVRFTFLNVRIIWLLIVTTSDVQTSRIGADGAKVGGGVDDEEAVDQVEEEAGVRPRIPPTWGHSLDNQRKFHYNFDYRDNLG